jgi:hypothetical protein
LWQVASDESDFEADNKPGDERVVTLKMVRELEDKLHNSRYHSLINQIVNFGGYSIL